MTKHCGVVTDRSWYDECSLRELWKIEEPVFHDHSCLHRIYSDEVPMADEKTLDWLRLSGMEKCMSLYPKLWLEFPRTILKGVEE